MIRGVEVFDLLLVRQLVELGHPVTVVADHSWRKRFEDLLAGATPEIMYTPSLRKPWLNGPVAEALLRGRRFSAMIVGNDNRGLLPTVKRLIRRGIADRRVLIAHRMPRDEYRARVQGVEIDVVAVNTQIASTFERVVNGRVQTRYGIVNADEFYPATGAEASDTVVKFCVLGKLDNEWKGAGQAIGVFRRLPARVRDSAELHLVAYPTEQHFVENNIYGSGWIAADRIPPLLRRMDVMLVLSKKEETFSQAMVQGMLTALPIIITDLPVLVEKLDAGGGVIVHNDEELGAAMTTLATDAVLRKRLGIQARKTALERYVWDTKKFVEDVLFRSAESTPGPTRDEKRTVHTLV